MDINLKELVYDGSDGPFRTFNSCNELINHYKCTPVKEWIPDKLCSFIMIKKYLKVWNIEISIFIIKCSNLC